MMTLQQGSKQSNRDQSSTVRDSVQTHNRRHTEYNMAEYKQRNQSGHEKYYKERINSEKRIIKRGLKQKQIIFLDEGS